jgi:hypothetical protein
VFQLVGSAPQLCGELSCVGQNDGISTMERSANVVKDGQNLKSWHIKLSPRRHPLSWFGRIAGAADEQRRFDGYRWFSPTKRDADGPVISNELRLTCWLLLAEIANEIDAENRHFLICRSLLLWLTHKSSSEP